MIGEIQLPWPNKALSPNSRVHWAAKAAATRSARKTAAWATKAAGLSKLDLASLKLTVTYSPPSRRRMDGDNLITSLKPSFDGIADVLGIDDSAFIIPAPIRADPITHGAIRILLEAI